MRNNELMRRKIRLSPTILSHWEKYYRKSHSSSVCGEPLRLSDLHSEFTHEESGRKFRVVGMTDIDSIICSEETSYGQIHWEVNKYFIQKCLGRRNEKFISGARGLFGFWEPFENSPSKMRLNSLD